MATQKPCHCCFHVHFPLLLIFSLVCILLVAESSASTDDDRKVYIVYMGHNPQGEVDPSFASSLHRSMLNDVVGRDAPEYLRRSYSRSFHGFSAKLTREEAQKFSGMEGVASVFPSQKYKLHTTRSWDFLGLPLDVKRSSTESDIIVGVLDSGIWPESESFSDKGYGPPPSKWKGICKTSANFSCNNKIIGARYYKQDGTFGPNDLQSPRDSDGHGTHTASTAAGNIVQKASLYGLRLGTARGGVPRARIAVYKVCWDDGCSDEDFLAAFDDAIADGVDIISISAGGRFAQPYFKDGLSIGSFHAVRKGILTSQSANNEGPNAQTIGSVSPWVLSVAAGTIESKLVTPVKLGNNVAYDGLSINTFELNHTYPLVFGGDVANTKAGFNGSLSSVCAENSLNKKLVKGKIVLCLAPSDGNGGVVAGAAGLLMGYTGPFFDLASAYRLPAAIIEANQTISTINYIKSTRWNYSEDSEIKDKLAPYVATFSGRGPNPITDSILKPDITAPGVSILAAYSAIGKFSNAAGDTRSISYNIISGTSMACPHVSGIAAYIKAFHPTWSPAAIKSAIMTTASPMSTTTNTDAEFAYGAGHVNPLKALDPGLIYDASDDDYVLFLCNEGYAAKQIKLFTGNKSSDCSALKNRPTDVNYPSFVTSTLRHMPTVVKFSRTVTNVGSASSTYKATVNQPPLAYASTLQIEVEPKVLKFQSVGEKLSYKVKIDVQVDTLEKYVLSASLTWSDGVHNVRSPIVVYVPA